MCCHHSYLLFDKVSYMVQCVFKAKTFHSVDHVFQFVITVTNNSHTENISH
jgi:hypothetical protein